MRPRRVYETVVYATELEAARAFYRDALGLREVEEGVFRLDDAGVLLLFDPTLSSQPGRVVPSHGPTGPVHVAFSVGQGELDAWREQLAEHGVEVEQDHEWQRGDARSLYVRDPAGNSVELVEGDLWPR
ncbi:MAG TPA: VOC family protein [Gaiellaceae bacterium]|nr:VOC family protein [Gaiellaceae bacterium]